MTTRTRIAVALLWAMSLVAVSRWTAHAQAPQASTPPGLEVRFVPEGIGDKGQPQGHLLVYAKGVWMRADVVPDQSMTVKPLR